MSMRKIVLSILISLLALCSINFFSFADENFPETELNVFTGMFDFSDDKQSSGLVGLQHQNDELFRQTENSKFSPITGAFITSKNAFYIYTGVQAEYRFGSLVITPSFAPGYYGEGNGKDLGYPLCLIPKCKCLFIS
jgi:hypothetical protein